MTEIRKGQTIKTILHLATSAQLPAGTWRDLAFGVYWHRLTGRHPSAERTEST